MTDQQCGTFEGQTMPAGAIGNVRALVDAIERSGINVDCTADDDGFAPWPFTDNTRDIDTEILEWIVSHARRRRTNVC
jgi:hypothetical protein